MRRGVTAVVAMVLAATILPSAASGAALVPLAPASAWPSDPIHATAPPGDPRLFVAERGGAVRVVENGVLRETPFLTVPNVDTGGERGLLSIAFAPDYASSGLLYVFTVAKAAGEFGAQPGELQIVEYGRSASGPDLADPASARLVLGIPHSNVIHNGGQIAFGPDGLLYVTVGDNGAKDNAQDPGNLLGKLLRIDPREQEGGAPYAVPSSNPFFGAGGGTKEEIYALGVRNPYRASFAPDGDLVVGDVGENTWEEVNAGDLAGANLGWPACEGACLTPNPLFTDPLFQYLHVGPKETTGCAIVGGYVVRDATLAGLTGRYLYGDFCRDDLRTIDLAVAGGDPRPTGLVLPLGGNLIGFGEDSGCRLYALTAATVHRIAPNAAAPPSGGPSTCPVATPIAAPSKQLRLRIRAARRQRLRGHVKVMAICSEACALRARGALLFFKRGSKAGSARLIPVSRPAKAGARNRFRLAVLKVKVRKRAKRMLKQGRRVNARVTVLAFDNEGESVRRHALVRLVR